jgi:peptidoglycan-associated lipoprotein
MFMKRFAFFTVITILMAMVAACGGRRPPVPNAPPPPAPTAFPEAAPPTAAARPPDPPPVPTETSIRSTPLGSYDTKSIEEINGPDSPLKAIYFAYDSDEIDEASRKVLAANADVLKTYRTWVITVEGHCDERGTAEYNLALGDRRALAARNYLVSLGIAPERMRTVSYGKEFPFDPEHNESSWSKNRRAHFMLTSK